MSAVRIAAELAEAVEGGALLERSESREDVIACGTGDVSESCAAEEGTSRTVGEDGCAELVASKVEEFDKVAFEVDELAVQRLERGERLLAMDADGLDLLHISRRRRTHPHEQISQRKAFAGDCLVPAVRDQDGDAFSADANRR